MDYNNETEENVQSEKEKILKDAEENDLREQLDEELETEEYENVEGSLKDGEATVSPETLSKLLKKFAIGVVAGVSLLIFIAIIHNFLDMDIKGVGNTEASYYPISCTGVYFTWENESYTKARQKKEKGYVPIMDASLVTDLDEVDPEYGERYTYEEYDFNTYIAGIIWTDNYDALDVDNEIVYQAMSIAARSRLIAELPDNCVVLKNYNEQAKSFTELTGSEEKYTEINQAVANSKGIIIGRNKEIIPAKYDPFTYISKRKEEDEAFKGTFYYQMTHKNEERQQVIPANWVDELEKQKGVEIPKEKSSDGEIKKLESMSLYGAKYLLEQADSQYPQDEFYRILEYYYGRDIEYYSIDPNSSSDDGWIGGTGCMWWPIGSLLTTEKDGITYADGAPETTRITSNFGPRPSPTPGASTYHKAIDIGGGVQGVTNIIAAADGEVIDVHTGCVKGDETCGGRLGNYVRIRHMDGTITRYGHMFSVSVSFGAKVKQGQVIGKMGSTGTSTGPHLDFQVIVNGTPVNPLNYVSPTNPRKQCYGGGVTIGIGNAQTICLSFKNQGYSNNAIAGVMGNLQAESGFDPLSVNEIGCVGIAQWCGRGNTLKSMYGSSWNTLNAQISFMFYELNGKFNSVKSYLHTNHSASDMAHHFCMHYEIPGESICNSGVRQGYATNTWLGYASNNCSD